MGKEKGERGRRTHTRGVASLLVETTPPLHPIPHTNIERHKSKRVFDFTQTIFRHQRLNLARENVKLCLVAIRRGSRWVWVFSMKLTYYLFWLE